MEPRVLLHGGEPPRAAGSATAAAVPQVNSRVDIVGMVKRVGRSRHLSHWDAEDLVAREAGGKSIARRGLPKKKGGVGLKTTGTSMRKFKPNLQRVRALVDGKVVRMRVCTGCIKSGRVTKPLAVLQRESA